MHDLSRGMVDAPQTRASGAASGGPAAYENLGFGARVTEHQISATGSRLAREFRPGFLHNAIVAIRRAAHEEAPSHVKARHDELKAELALEPACAKRVIRRPQPVWLSLQAKRMWLLFNLLALRNSNSIAPDSEGVGSGVGHDQGS